MAKARRPMLPNGEIFNEREWKIAKKRAKAMYEHRCVFCSKELDDSAKAFTHNSIEVDHIYPLSLGGHPYELTNLQLLCMRCNRKKSNKVPVEGIPSNYEEPLPLSSGW